MKKFTKLVAVLLFAAMLITTTLPVVGAESVNVSVEIDIGGLFDDAEETPGDDKNEEETTPTVPPADDKDDNGNQNLPSDKDTTNITTTDKTGKDKTENKDDKKEEETKEEEKVYNSKFSDVAESAWYYSYVTDLASKGIITGYPDGTFAPQGNITRAEFIKLLVQCMGYELTNNDVFEDVTKDDPKDWYYTYVSAAADNKVISVEDYGKEFKGDEKIKREEVAALIIKATGAETGKYASPYVDTVDKNVVALYAICLMQGTVDDKSGDRYFFPDWNITRAEVSTVFSRLLEYNADKDKFVKEKMAEYGITEMKLLSLPKTEKQFYEAVKSAGLNPALSYSIEVDNPTNDIARYLQNSLHSGFLACFWSHPEYFSYLNYTVNGVPEIVRDRELKFSFESYSQLNTLESINAMYNDSKKLAKDIALKISLNNYGASKLELAGLVHDYIVDNTTYFHQEKDFRYLTYGALAFGSAVCQGYAGAFNMICHELGINSVAVVNDDHMWNVVKIDGKYYYYDCTWDEPDEGTTAKTTYRGVSERIIRATHGDFIFFKFAMPQDNETDIVLA